MEDNKKVCPEGCRCENCQSNCCCSGMSCRGMWRGGCCGIGRHHILRWILGLLILAAVFCGGFKLGVIVGSINKGFGYNHGTHIMLRGFNQDGYGPGMMGWYYNKTSTSTTK